MLVNHVKTVKPRLESQKRLGGMLADHYIAARELAKTRERPIAWASILAPAEILWSMDFCVQFPESYAVTSGARHLGHDYCALTERNGYERHLCTYCRNHLGATIGEINGIEPYEGLARPDFLLVANNSCVLITKWWEHLSDLLGIPMFNIDCPVIVDGMDEKLAVAHVKNQCLDLIDYLQEFTGKKFDYDKLKEIVTNGRKSSENYRAMLNLNKHDPAPATFFDLMFHNFPNLALRYKPEAAEHYRLMEEELKQRIQDGIVPMENMKYRIYWDGIPYWFAINSLSKKLQSLGICLVTGSYLEVFTYDRLDPERPLESVAENTALSFFSNTLSQKAEITKRLIIDYQLEGGIFAYSLSCKPASVPMRYTADFVQKQTNIPVVMIEGDPVDEAFYDEERNNMKFQVLVEMLEAREKAG